MAFAHGVLLDFDLSPYDFLFEIVNLTEEGSVSVEQYLADTSWR